MRWSCDSYPNPLLRNVDNQLLIPLSFVLALSFAVFTFSRFYQPWRLELLRSIRPSPSQVLLFAGFLSHATSDDIATIAIAERVPMASTEELQQLEITALRSIYDEDFIDCPPPKAWKVSWTILLHCHWFFTVMQGAGGLPEFIIKVPHPDPTHASKVNVQLHVKWV